MFGEHGQRLLFQCMTRLNARSMQFIGQRYKNTLKVNRMGRNGSYGPMPSNDRHFRVAMEKAFTRNKMKTFGVETGLEEMKILTHTRGQNVYRRLDEKKRKQLTSLYTEHICSFIALEESLAKYAIRVTKIELPKILHEILVYWQCYGDQRDDELNALFVEHGNRIWRQLADIFGDSTPPLRFIGDRQALHLEEMNCLFELADYGMSYRAVSKAGAILGSTHDTTVTASSDALDERNQQVPRWAANRERRRRARELALVEANSNDSSAESDR